MQLYVPFCYFIPLRYEHSASDLFSRLMSHFHTKLQAEQEFCVKHLHISAVFYVFEKKKHFFQFRILG
jgi:hypothetical protein